MSADHQSERLSMRLYVVDVRLLRACLIELRRTGPYGPATTAADVVRAGLQALARDLGVDLTNPQTGDSYAAE